MKEQKKKNGNPEMDSEMQMIRGLQENIRKARAISKKKPDEKPYSGKGKGKFFATGILICILSILIIWLRYRSQPVPSSEHPQLEAVELVRVVDGDTIIVDYAGEEVRVRLLTVNCQESVHPDASRNNAEGEAASTFTKDYLADYPVLYLQFDEELYDRYDRLLAYVWLEDKVSLDSKQDVEQYMFNAILLKEGYAETIVYEPNHRYAEWFYEIEEAAKSDRN